MKGNMSIRSFAGRLERVVASLALVSLTGCAGFFPPIDRTGGGGGTTTGDYVYVANSFTSTSSGTSSAYSITGFAVGTNALTAISGATQTLEIPPQAMAVTPDNAHLYVIASGVLYGYTIGTGGVLTPVKTATNGVVLANANMVSMVVSPDGKWLLGLDGSQQVVGIDEFSIDSSTGLLGAEIGGSYTLTSGRASLPSSITVSPKGDFIGALLGTGGLVEFNLATSTGAVTFAAELASPTTSSASQAAVYDANSATVYVAVSGTNDGVYPYTIGNGGGLTVVAGAPFPLGTASTAGPASILIDKTGTFLYVGNRTAGSISGFSIATGGVLTALSGSPYTAGTTVTALAYDNSGSYILAGASGGSPDLQLYSLDATSAGKLNSGGTALTGNGVEPAGTVAIAVTHPTS